MCSSVGLALNRNHVLQQRAAFSRNLLYREELGGGPDAADVSVNSSWDHFASAGVELRDIQFGGR